MHLKVLVNIILVSVFAFGCDENQNLAATKANNRDLCNFHQGPCLVSVGENFISLELKPNTAPSEKPISFKFKLSDNIDNIEAKLEGRDMFMGIIPLKLTKIGESEYEATAIYGRCASNYMVWRLWLTLTYKNGVTEQTWFDFKADNTR